MCTHSESLYGRCMDCGMTWAEQSARIDYPIGSSVKVDVYGIGGRMETVTGEVIGFNRGVTVSTESHGTLSVEYGKVRAA